jgi:uncharacterized membrane protein AbrB (regulator of aidB expression)
VSAGTGTAISLLILAAGVALGAYLLNVPIAWIVAGLIVAGVALATVRRRTRRRAPPF